MARSAIRSLSRALGALSLSLVLGLAHAQDGDVPGDVYEADPPGRAARLSYLQGEVSLQPAGEEDWAPALLNRPLTTGDKLWTEQGARAEIQVGQAAVRLDGGTGFSFLDVDDDSIQMRMTAGVLNVRVHALIEDEHIEIDTPNVALSLLRPGNYRVEVDDENDTTVVKISEGEAEATGPEQGRSVIVRNQQVATFRGTDPLAAQFASLGGPDEFDSWSLERDRREERVAASPTAEYVSPDVTGYEDLEEYGTWSQEPEYGYVWTPSHVAVGWAPYQFGRWVWISPWGWTWVDDSPWGYAPFHYGRWAHVRHRWCWVPGPRRVRAVYAPALVGWVGTPGVGVSVGVGRVGWFPLGPREIYVPARRFSPRYVERVNVSNTIANRIRFRNFYDRPEHHYHYRNRDVPGAVTSVARNVFTSGRRVNEHRVRLDGHEITRVAARPPRIEPARESRFGGATRTNFRPPRAVAERPVVVKRKPPTASERLVHGVANRLDASRAPQRQRPPHDAGAPSNSIPKPSAGLQPGQRPAVVSPRGDRPRLERRPDVDRSGRDRPRQDPGTRHESRVLQQVRERQQQQLERQQDRERSERAPEFQREAARRQALREQAMRQQASQPPRAERAPEMRRPEVRRPEVRQHEARRPDVLRPEVRQPDNHRPEAHRPEVRQPPPRSQERSSHPAPSRPATSRPMPWKRESARPAHR
ncbi:MAG TPA: DUF6600 domain-containing protein [Steroidobacteraceae bacterium]|nr:DUF6600 domain-containing protein [Steroidobacteraceae bacterium]